MIVIPGVFRIKSRKVATVKPRGPRVTNYANHINELKR